MLDWCKLCWKERRSWLPSLIVAGLSLLYILLLVLYGRVSSATLQVSHMIKAKTCVIDYLGHKSGSTKITQCCRERLGVLCKHIDYMPCPSISVRYVLPEEEFVRAGYINYWDPQTLRIRYASNSHCMIVPITCPKSGDEWKYTMDYIYTLYDLGQHLNCYVYKDIPETPLLIQADIFSHIMEAVLILTAPPLVILAALIICIVVRPTKLEKLEHRVSDDEFETQNLRNSEKDETPSGEQIS